MSVLSVSVTRPDYPLLRNVALKNGIQCDLVEVTETEVYADLVGETERSIRVSLRAGATRHALLDAIEHGERIRSYPSRPTS